MDERFTPHMFVSWYAAQRGVAVKDLGVAPVVVLSWSRRVVQSLAEDIGAQLSQHWMYEERYPLYTGEVEGHRVSFRVIMTPSSRARCFQREQIAPRHQVMITRNLCLCSSGRAGYSYGHGGDDCLWSQGVLGAWIRRKPSTHCSCGNITYTHRVH